MSNIKKTTQNQKNANVKQTKLPHKKKKLNQTKNHKKYISYNELTIKKNSGVMASTPLGVVLNSIG